MRKVITRIVGDPGSPFANGTFIVSAKVNDKLVVNREPVECWFIKDHDLVSISIYWEEAGFKNYKEMGLFGKMNTKWQRVKRREDWLYVYSDSYKIRISL